MNARDNHWTNSLLLAVVKEHLDAVIVLLTPMADVKIISPKGGTAPDAANETGNREDVPALKEKYT